MKTLEKVKVLLMALLVIITCASITACGGDDDDNDNEGTNTPDYNGGGNSGNSNGGSNTSSSTYDILKKNIFASVNYNDYSWDISIKSNLANIFPTKNIIYGIESGYGKYKYYEHFTFKNEYLQKNDGNGNIKVCYPVFVGDEYPYMLYWSSYKALENKKAGGEVLTNDEKSLWNEIVQIMKKDESNAKGAFCGRLYAQFDGTRYVFYTFGQMPNSGNTGSGNSGDSGSSGSSGTGGGSSTTYEKPEIGLEDYTCYTTSITVKYRIYNQDKAKVTSAKGYYGTSSASQSVSASVAGSLITIRITGLKKGTSYYVKCSATGKGGTTTSSSTKLITDY